MSRRVTAALIGAVASALLLVGGVGCGAPPGADCTTAQCAGSTQTAAPDPATVDIPKLAAHSTLLPLGLNSDDTVAVPPVETPMQAGWYAGLRDDTSGGHAPVVILGHVNGGGHPGIFARLTELAPGDTVTVGYGNQQRTFRITRVLSVPKSQFPTGDVYGNTPDQQIRLITCGGRLDAAAHNYLDQVIAFGVAA